MIARTSVSYLGRTPVNDCWMRMMMTMRRRRRTTTTRMTWRRPARMFSVASSVGLDRTVDFQRSAVDSLLLARQLPLVLWLEGRPCVHRGRRHHPQCYSTLESPWNWSMPTSARVVSSRVERVGHSRRTGHPIDDWSSCPERETRWSGE